MSIAERFTAGSLVRARGREWVVLPESEPDLLVVRPLGGTDDEIAGILLAAETVEPAAFDLPDPARVGDNRSASLLRDAVRLGFRSSAGPFRSFAQIAVEPRPYQLVPLLMALRQDPVRLLIADDVGVGKTVEAALVVRELLDRGEVQRFVVLCPPHLAPQWQAELAVKFHLEAELVLPGTISRLERQIRASDSVFDVFPYLIVSTDFIKADRRRDDFLRACPELVVVDEAHTCAFGETGRGGRHQRHQLVKGVAGDPNRHLILVTATPHSGNEDAFRSLLTLLDPRFADLPDDLSGSQHQGQRRELARYFVQRRRADIRHYMQADTPFPDRQEQEATYALHPEYAKLFDGIVKYARETVLDPSGTRHQQRVRWWSALALLRSIGSSPAAAVATLRSRAATADTTSVEEADELGERLVLDLEEDESAERIDIAPGGDAGDTLADEASSRRRLLAFARQAEALKGAKDNKLQTAIALVEALVRDGYQPIVFCRFIPTAEYVADALRAALGKGVEVAAVTGLLPPDDRQARVQQLGQAGKRVLVCTDCLSEGINLQEHFNAVMHYDLSWNPTRHEQREGRVDRFGQRSPAVRVLTYFGRDSRIDGIVLDVLLRKHKTIRNSLGISVPVPADTQQVIEAIFEGLLLREQASSVTAYLPGFEELLAPKQMAIIDDWQSAAERERRSRTVFAQEGIRVDEVAAELQAVRDAIGSSVDVARFVERAVTAHGGIVSAPDRAGVVSIDLTETPRGLRDALGQESTFRAIFTPPGAPGAILLQRTHPVVAGLAAYVLDTALDELGGGVAARCGVIRTRGVGTRTSLLLLRYRFHLQADRASGAAPLLAEDIGLLAFEGSPDRAVWLSEPEAEHLLDLEPAGSIATPTASDFVRRVIDGMDHLYPQLNEAARDRATELLQAHRRVRQAAQTRVGGVRVEPQLPPDVVGVYIYLPAH